MDEVERRLVSEYKNGNCKVSIYSDGTKEREWPEGENPQPKFPESIDVKITDFCDAGCSWCHESSTTLGQHARIGGLMAIFNGLPAGVEVAIGGGDPFSYPDLPMFLRSLRGKGLVANITVNGYHLARHHDMIEEARDRLMFYGLGITYDPRTADLIPGLADDTTVVHVIAGVHNPNEVMRLPKDIKLLVLGYKSYGRGRRFFNVSPVLAHLDEWRYWTGTLMRTRKVSFDTLALTQLKVRDWIPDNEWYPRFMGHDGQFSMYVDAVTNSFALNSMGIPRSLQMRNAAEAFEFLQTTLRTERAAAKRD